jgi:hypothetical protein
MIMRVFQYSLCSLFLMFSLLSCQDRSLSESTLNQLDAESEIYDLLAYIENTDAELESVGERFESLVFTSDASETKAVFWYKNDTLRIIRHQIRDTKTNVQSEISYYFDITGLVLVQELIDSPVSEDEMQTTEYITFYSNEQALRSWINNWYGGFADPLQYEDTEIRKSDFTQAIDMYSLRGDYALSFDDFLVNEQDTYLLVETTGKIPYIAALKVERLDGFLTELYNNKSKYKKTPIQIDYQVVSEQGWIFSYYRSGDFK